MSKNGVDSSELNYVTANRFYVEILSHITNSSKKANYD